MVAALLGSLREEVEVWKTKFQEQVEATAAAATAVPNGESGDSAELDKALQDVAQAQEEASRWKEKAVAAQELEGESGRFVVLFVNVFCFRPLAVFRPTREQVAQRGGLFVGPAANLP